MSFKEMIINPMVSLQVSSFAQEEQF